MNDIAKIRLVITDVDGTLVTGDKILTDAAAAAVRDLHNAGIAIAITSGRPPRGMQMLVAPLDLRTPIVGFNGGTIVNPDLSVMETRNLAPDAARSALDIILGQGLDAWLYTADQWLVLDDKAPHVAHEAWTVKFEPNVVEEFGDALLARTVKIVGVSDNHSTVEATERMLQQEMSAQAASSRSQPFYLDVTHPQANKGAAVDRLSALLGIERQAIATIGDGPNDVLMFRRSGLSIAMGNASEAVRAHAMVVTDSNEEDGFATALRRFVLAACDTSPRAKAEQ